MCGVWGTTEFERERWWVFYAYQGMAAKYRTHHNGTTQYALHPFVAGTVVGLLPGVVASVETQVYEIGAQLFNADKDGVVQCLRVAQRVSVVAVHAVELGM